MKKKLVTAIAAAMIFSMVPAIPAAAEEVATAASSEEVQTADQTTVSTENTTENTTEVSTDAEAASDNDTTAAETKSAKTKSAKTVVKKKAAPKKTTKKKKKAKKAYKPVNARKLTSAYKSKLLKKRRSVVSARRSNVTRHKFEENALIDLAWSELKDLSQVKITRGDFDLMCRVVSAEAGDSASYQAKEMTAECIVNRAKGYKNSNPVASAIRAKGQFSVVRNGSINRVTVNGETVNACKDALIKNSHPKSLYYFSAGRYFSWARPYMHLNGTYFCLKK